MGRLPKKLKSLIEVPCVAHLKVHVLNFNMNLVSSPQGVLRPTYPFQGKLDDQEKDRSPKKLKFLIEVPYVANLIVQVVSFSMILISSPKCVPRPSCPFLGKFGRTGKGSLNEKAKIVDRGSIINVPERTGSNLKYEPYLFSVAGSQTELSISGKMWEIR